MERFHGERFTLLQQSPRFGDEIVENVGLKLDNTFANDRLKRHNLLHSRAMGPNKILLKSGEHLRGQLGVAVTCGEYNQYGDTHRMITKVLVVGRGSGGLILISTGNNHGFR